MAVCSVGRIDPRRKRMSTVLPFEAPRHARPRTRPAATNRPCEIVIFPGVRIERHDLDLSFRLRDSAGHDDFDGLGGNNRPRKSS